MDSSRAHIGIGGMQCSFCRQSLERALGRVPGVSKAAVNLAHEEALVDYDGLPATYARVTGVVRSLGYSIRDPRKLRAFEQEEEELSVERRRLLLAALISGSGLSMMIVHWLHAPFPARAESITMAVLAGIVVFGVGARFLAMAWAALRRRILNQHVLLSFGALGGYLAGLIGLFDPALPATDFFGAAAFLVTYHTLSSFVAGVVRTRASQAVRRILELQPDTARVLRNGDEIELPVDEVNVDENIRVRAGDRIPLDGEVVKGIASVDESMVTGEPMPVTKRAHQPVIAGSIDIDGTLVVRVTSAAQESFVARVASEVEAAKALKPAILVLVERILEIYVPAILTIAGATLAGWVIAGALHDAVNWERAIFATLSVLVMGYPCALGMATPLAMIRGGGEAAQRGILMRNAESFEAIKDVGLVIFDKTGTITLGKPAVVGEPPGDVLRVAAAVEKLSNHALAAAIVAYAKKRGNDIPDVSDFNETAGRGASGSVDGKQIVVGSLRFLAERGIAVTEDAIRDLPEFSTIVGVARDGSLLGTIALGDEPRPEARETVARLRAQSIECVMITGDNERVAKAIAVEVGIERVVANALPDEKATRIRELQIRSRRRIAMVGDGINDAPALMQADAGIAMGTGTDIAIESADVVVMSHALSAVPDLIAIARSSYAKTRQNLALAFAFNGIGIPVAASGLLYPAWAMAAMAASVTTVLLNSFGVSWTK